QRMEIGKQHFVLEHPARKDHRGGVVACGQFLRCLAKTNGYSELEGTGNFAGGPAIQAILYQLQEQRTEIEFAAGKWQRIRLYGRCFVREVLKPYGGLAFESDFTRKANECRSGIKKAPDRSNC